MFEKFINDLKNDKLKFATICVAIVAFVSGIVVTAVNSGSTYASDATTTSAEACYACNSDSNILKWGTSATSDSACPAGYHGLGSDVERDDCATHKLILDFNNSSSSQIFYRSHGSKFNLGDHIPSKTGYTFKGWDKSSDATTVQYSATANITVNDDIGLFAVWDINDYTIKFYNDGKVTNSVSREYNSTLSLSAYTPSKKTGYVFKGWDTDSSADSVIYKSTSTMTINKSWNLYAVWELEEGYYELIYDANGENVTNLPESKLVSVGTVTLSSTKPTRSGYEFLGWSENKDAETATYQPSATAVITKNMTLYAVWAPVREVHFYLTDGGDFVDTNGTILAITQSRRDCVYTNNNTWCKVTTPIAKKEGLNFCGWSTIDPVTNDGECSKDLLAGNTVLKVYSSTAKSYHACYKTKCTTSTVTPSDPDTPSTGEYNIKYTLNGGTNASGNPSSAKKDAEVTINHPTKSFDVTCDKNNTGATIGTAPKATFTFQGWTSSDLDTSTAMYGSTKWSNGSTLVKDTKFKNLTGVGKTVTLVANWNDVVVKLPSVTKDGYTCKWNTKADGTGTSISSGGDYTVSKNSTSATVYAICTENTGKNKYNIKYELNGGTVTGNPTSAEYDVEVTINQPSKSVTVNCNENKTGATIGKSPIANLEFEGWTSPDVDTSTAMYGTTKWSDRATLVKDTKFKNLTPVNNGTVTMVANWKDGVVTLPSITKKNYTCNWNTSSDGKGASYKPGDKYTVDKNSVSVNMYAICVKNDDNIKNPGTGSSIIIAAWIVGLGAIGFSVYYYMRRRNNI